MSEATPPGTATPEATPSLLSGGGQGGGAEAPDWRASLPEDIRGHPTIGKFKGVDALAKSYVELERHAGADKATLLRMPKDEADAAGWSEVWTRLGRPENAAGYGLKPVDGIVDEGAVGEFAAKAHEWGMPRQHAEKAMGLYVGMVQAGLARKQAEAVEAAKVGEADLRREWGGGYDDKIHAMKLAIDRFGGDGLKEAFDKAGLGTNPAVVKMFAQIGEMLGEGGLKGGGQGGMGRALTPEAARAEWEGLQKDQDFMAKYLRGDGPSLIKARELFVAMNPAQAA